jgi:hypothetical protein
MSAARVAAAWTSRGARDAGPGRTPARLGTLRAARRAGADAGAFEGNVAESGTLDERWKKG